MLDFAKMYSTVLFETYFYQKDIWIAATDYYMYFYLILLPPPAILKLRNFTAS